MRKIEKIIHRKKKAYFQEQMKQLKKLHGQKKKSRRMYELVNDVRKEFKPCMIACRDITEMIMNEPSEIMELWRQHFQNLTKRPKYFEFGDYPIIRRSGKGY